MIFALNVLAIVFAVSTALVALSGAIDSHDLSFRRPTRRAFITSRNVATFTGT
jgi:hypothetical protein